MASSIDPAIPPFGNATTAGVRNNFAAAKSEIEALQGARIIRVDFRGAVETFQQCVANGVPQVITLTNLIFNDGAIFTFDSVNSEIEYAETGWYAASVSSQTMRKVAGGGIADWSIHAQHKLPSGSFINVDGSARQASFSGSVANHKVLHSIDQIVKVDTVGTRVRWLQTCSDVSREVGLITYPAAGALPAIPGIRINLRKIGEL